MLDDVGLVHMNGRVYDPSLGRFMQADPFVQAPTYSQSYNRYSYGFNNPLRGTDPSGYDFLGIDLGDLGDWFDENVTQPIGDALGIDKQDLINAAPYIALIAAPFAYAYIGLITNPFVGALAGGFTLGYVGSGFNLQAGLMGAVTAGVFYGVGNLAQAGNWNPVEHTLAHAAAGGTTSVLQGGKFGEGALAAGFAQAFSGSIETHFDYDGAPGIIARTTAAAVIGGTASELGGGSFANGARTAAFARLFNDELHNHDTEVEVNKKELAKTLGEIYEQGKYKTGVFGEIFVTKDVGDLSVSVLTVTVNWGLRDIQYYRIDQIHVPYPQASLIRWNEVDWSLYDQGGPPESAMKNFFDAVDR